MINIVPQKDIPKEFFDLIAMGMSTVNVIWFRGKSLVLLLGLCISTKAKCHQNVTCTY